MKITLKDVEHVAALSMLYVSEEEKLSLQKNLDDIIAHVQKLNELDTEGIEPTTYIMPQQNIFREDAVKEKEFAREELLKNAPAQEDGYFLVPKVVE